MIFLIKLTELSLILKLFILFTLSLFHTIYIRKITNNLNIYIYIYQK